MATLEIEGQADLFEYLEERKKEEMEEEVFTKGDKVKVKFSSQVGTDMSIETETYLDGYFAGRKGTIFALYNDSYEVLFEDGKQKNKGIFHGRELELV